MALIDQEIVLALGSNEVFENADSAEVLDAAIAELERRGLVVLRQSRKFHTPCFPVGAGPDYVNAVIVVRAGMDPAQLLTLLHEVEAGLGRKRRVRWGARTVDIDLIACADMVLPDYGAFLVWKDLPPDKQAKVAPEELILPHPRMHERAFVLVPMLDVAPDWVHPVLGLSVRQMCGLLPAAALDEVRPI